MVLKRHDCSMECTRGGTRNRPERVHPCSPRDPLPSNPSGSRVPSVSVSLSQNRDTHMKWTRRAKSATQSHSSDHASCVSAAPPQPTRATSQISLIVSPSVWECGKVQMPVSSTTQTNDLTRGVWATREEGDAGQREVPRLGVVGRRGRALKREAVTCQQESPVRDERVTSGRRATVPMLSSHEDDSYRRNCFCSEACLWNLNNHGAILSSRVLHFFLVHIFDVLLTLQNHSFFPFVALALCKIVAYLSLHPTRSLRKSVGKPTNTGTRMSAHKEKNHRVVVTHKPTQTQPKQLELRRLLLQQLVRDGKWLEPEGHGLCHFPVAEFLDIVDNMCSLTMTSLQHKRDLLVRLFALQTLPSPFGFRTTFALVDVLANDGQFVQLLSVRLRIAILSTSVPINVSPTQSSAHLW